LLPVGSQLPFRTNRPEDLCGSGSCLTFEFRLLNYILDGVRASDGVCAASRPQGSTGIHSSGIR
jgi:hypothetical protein